MDAVVELVGVGEREESAARPVRLAPCEPETGCGAANWVVDVVDDVVGGGIVEDEVGAGAADWKSSNSSSS